MDRTGKVVIPPTFDDVNRDNYGGFIHPSRRPFLNFSEGLCAVRLGRKWGYIDHAGKFVIAPRFDNGGAFCEGLACVRDGSKLGYIDKTGAYVIPVQFEWPNIPENSDTPDLDFTKEIMTRYEFGDGLAPAMNNHRFGYVNHKGEFVVAAKYDQCVPFFNGRGLVRDGDTWRVFDRSGKEVASSDNALSYTDGLFLRLVSPIADVNRRIVFVDKSGKQAFPGEFSDAREFSEGLACVAPNTMTVAKEDFAYGYIDKTGKILIPPSFYVSGNNMASAFNDGRAVVSKVDTDSLGNNHVMHGVIDTTGRWIVPPKYDHISTYREGLARVFNGTNAFFIDKNGTTVVTAPSIWCNSYSDGLCAFMK